MLKVYLDSSGIAKRYLEEKGSKAIDVVYTLAEIGKLQLAFSIWNVGEVLGAFNKYRSKGLIPDSSFETCVKHFLLESIKMIRSGSLLIHPVTSDILIGSWGILLMHRVYQADAIQVSTAKQLGCSSLLSADTGLIKVARSEGMDAWNVERDADRISKIFLSDGHDV